MSVLERIVAYKREEVAARKHERSLEALEREIATLAPPRDFVDALEKHAPALIAELKKASPSRGLIRANFDPAALARAYERGGCACRA